MSDRVQALREKIIGFEYCYSWCGETAFTCEKQDNCPAFQGKDKTKENKARYSTAKIKADQQVSFLVSQELGWAEKPEVPAFLYHTVLGMSEVEPSTIRDAIKSIMMYGLIPRVPDEWADLLPSFLRSKPIVWLADGIYQGYQRGRILRVEAGLLDKIKLFKVEISDVKWWVYEGIIPPHLIKVVTSKQDMLKAGAVKFVPLEEI